MPSNIRGGSPQRLFVLVYAVGILVTELLSNDATAIVLTPAIYDSTCAGARPLTYLFSCGIIANAASFVLPISYPEISFALGERMPLILRLVVLRREKIEVTAWRSLRVGLW